MSRIESKDLLRSMRNRSLSIGVGVLVAAIAFVVCVILAMAVPRVSEPLEKSTMQEPEAVLSAAELASRAASAEASLNQARERFKDRGVATVLMSRIRSYFIVVGPICLVCLFAWCRRARPLDLALTVGPTCLILIALLSL